ncbi:hypothetical protein K461DRAFT_290743 [Myriangium duriaei CBS 260.36]|uniref:Restriction of telomere capping protein 4 n=1 Tax=Myriangium duriaei CBS 260.36 TaxID=1168546 RepID=A0A9P4MI99_9PEZI|nr:hypothetical protein K461DRAFT_290743 [Myriangium duriaei CBS 260.36]
MPTLSRQGARPLLRTVNGQPHASNDDHEPQIDSRGSSPLSDAPNDIDVEDFTRDPESSSSEDETPTTIQGFGSKAVQNLQSPPLTNSSGNIHSSRPKANERAKPGSTRVGTKRKQEQEQKDVDDQPDWMTSSQQSKRSRTGTKYVSASQRSNNTFKRPLVTPRSSDDKSDKRSFKRPAQTSGSAPASSQPESTSAHNGFVRPSADQARFPSLKPGHSDDMPSSPPLSSPKGSDLSDVEEVWLDGHNPADYEPCPLCEKSVSKAFKVIWEEEHCKGRRMNLKMQEKFCRAHKLDEAETAWKERNYPEIKWEALSKRLAKFKPRIDRVLDGKTESSFRDEFEEIVKQADSRTVMKAWKGGSTDGPRAGYYGGKGAKIISEYSLKAFARKLPRVAGRDKSLATASVKGGVSGFVQAVVVPELALSLIMDDLNVDEVHARKVLDESTAVGNTLNIEEEGSLPRRAPTPPPAYGADGSSSPAARRASGRN